MGRSKNTIRTQYARAKKKLPADTNTTAMPPDYQKKALYAAFRRDIHEEIEKEKNAAETIVKT